jgi:hypothetical protein
MQLVCATLFKSKGVALSLHMEALSHPMARSDATCTRSVRPDHCVRLLSVEQQTGCGGKEV